MGLLDSILAQGQSGGGIFGGLYPSSLQPDQQQMDYDAMGNPIPKYLSADSPFPALPAQAAAVPQMAAQAPVAGGFGPWGAGSFMPQQQPIAPAPQPPVQPPTDVSPINRGPDRTIDIGGYQMPQFGGAPQSDPGAIPQSAQPAQYSPQQPNPSASTQPSFLGPQNPGLGDRISAGLSGLGAGGKSGGLFGALTSGINGLQTGQSSDPRAIAQQNLKAQYDSLLPMLGPQKAMLAVMNPEAGKILLAQALEKKQYGFTKLDNDTVVRQDPQTGKVEVAYGGAKSDTIAGPDGKLITMPEGADPKTWRNEITRINADVAAGKKTEVQAKSEIFANKMELSERSINDLAVQGTSLTGKIASGVPLGNYVQSPEYQKYKQASSNFITALLRQESGAAISKSEFDRYDKEYMPQPGDGPEVLAQKSEARRVAIEGMKKGAGPGYKPPAGAAPTGGGFKTQTGVSWSVVK